MNFDEALLVFNITDITKVTKADLMRSYRKLMKKHHPDIGGSEEMAKKINSANEIIYSALCELDKLEMDKPGTIKTAFIDIDDLQRIYNQEEVIVTGKDGSLTVNKSTINTYHVMMSIEAIININGIDYRFHTFTPKNNSDEYSIRCIYPCGTTVGEIRSIVKAYGKNISIILKNNDLNLNLTFDHGIKLRVMIERQLIRDE